MDGYFILASSPTHFWIVAALSVFFLSVAKSGFGGALASMSLPVMLFVLSPKEALAVLLPMFLTTSIGVFFIWYKHCHWRLVGLMCLFALVGQFVGWLVFDHLTDHLLQLCIGVVAVMTAANYWVNILQARAETKTPAWAEKHLWKRVSIWGGIVWHVKFRVLVWRHTGTDFPVTSPPQQRGLCRLIQRLFYGDRFVESTTFS